MLRIIFMGTPEFALPDAGRHRRGGARGGRRSIRQPPRPAGRGMAEQKSPVHLFAERHGLPVLTPKSLKREPEQHGLRGARRRRRGRRGLRADPAQARARGAAPWLPQSACLGPAALARRRPHPARRHGRRRGDGSHRHAHGRGARHRARLPHRARADRAGHDGRRAARPAGRAGRRADGARPGRARARRACLHAAALGRRHLCRQDRQGRDAHRFHAARARGAQSRARAVAGAGGLVRGRSRGKGASA